MFNGGNQPRLTAASGERAKEAPDGRCYGWPLGDTEGALAEAGAELYCIWTKDYAWYLEEKTKKKGRGSGRAKSLRLSGQR